MNPDQLTALFQQNRPAVLAVAGAGVVGLGLLARKKKTAAAGGATGLAGATQPAGTLPAAALVSPTAGYDSTAYDVYQSMEGQLQQLQQQQAAQTGTSSGPIAAPTPIASTLFAPTKSGTYALYGNGTVAEVESDGSQLGLSYGQWEPLRQGGAAPTINLPGSATGQFFTSAGNLSAKTLPATPTA